MGRQRKVGVGHITGILVSEYLGNRVEVEES